MAFDGPGTSRGSDSSNLSLSYAVISNIPKCYHSSDLRNFFSEFVETKGFDCFHFRHRPAIRQLERLRNESGQVVPNFQKTTCAIVRLRSSKTGELLKKYNGKHWVDREGFTLPLKCCISKVRITDCGSSESGMRYQTRKEQMTVPSSRVVFTKENLLNLAELKPPSIMPNGNVGTPTEFFLGLIRECRMPGRLIGKLGLVFPKIRGKRKYGSVPFDYGGHIDTSQDDDDDEFEEDIRTAKGHLLTDVHSKPPVVQEEYQKTSSKDVDGDSDDDAGEEWERHESLHDDVTEQERTKERLYEDEIELQWEKGGSGLVFYTDAQYWDEQKGDFDERTSDDWDIDTSVYYNEDGSGDQDAVDYVQMLLETKRRNGVIDSAFEKIGRFEKHTKGIGRKLLERQGWKDGQGIGKTVQGIPVALDNDGRHPRDKKGFGYHGEKLPRFGVKKRRKDVLISTVYDDPLHTDPPEHLLRRNPTTVLKHRCELGTVQFQKASKS